MRFLVINFKNYKEILGSGSVELAAAAEEAARVEGVTVIVAPPTPMLALVASKVKIPVFCQSVGGETSEKSTGATPAGAALGAGCRGTILNHSESRRSPEELSILVPAVRALGLQVCLCAGSKDESASLAALHPDFLAVEPPELIGSGIAVSKAQPNLVRDTVTAVRNAGFKGGVLCGAGIVDGSDVSKAVELGADGVLVSSSVVKAKDWRAKTRELSRSLI